MRGWAGKKSQKKVNWKSQKKSKKVKKKSNVRILALADYWRQQKVKKKSKKVQKKSKVEKVKKKSKKSPKKVEKKSKKSQKKVKCENQARILALADYWRQQKVQKKSKKSRKKVEKKSILLATLGPDRAGYLGLWGGYQGHQGQGWLGAEETLGQWLGLGRGPATLG